jgi:hypothetical protein
MKGIQNLQKMVVMYALVLQVMDLTPLEIRI